VELHGCEKIVRTYQLNEIKAAYAYGDISIDHGDVLYIDEYLLLQAIASVQMLRRLRTTW